MADEVQAQSIIDRFNPLAKGQVLPPAKIVSATGAAVNAYNYDDNVGSPLQELVLQNVSTQAVKYALNTDATANAYHGILPADTGVEAGASAPRTINIGLGVRRVSLFAAAAFTVVATAVANTSVTRR